jgi:IS1 family transposase
LKYETLERSLETTTILLDVLKTTKETFERTLTAEYDTYEQKLKQSQTINEQ